MITTPRRVRSTDRVSLAVYESGVAGGPVVIAVHGYPDNHTVWDGVTALLGDRFRVITYDVRGTGASDKPGARAAYRMPRLTDDLVSVVDAVSPDAPVHLIAHDWGSIQTWPALADRRLCGRVLSFVSISGPSLDYSAVWMRRLRAHPRDVARQLAHSYYLGLFQLPLLPELAARHGLIERSVSRSGRRARSSLARHVASTRSDDDRVNGLELYRANMVGRMSRPEPVPTEVPVLVLAPQSDAFVTPALAIGAPREWVADLTVRRISGGHWVVSERPDVIARIAGEFMDGVGGARTAAAPVAGARAGVFGGRLAVVTGGARGIGRATALELARGGADVLVADIDGPAAKQTVTELRELGVGAWSAHLDVADAEAWTTFAATVRAEHGVPQIVVNNAGIGMGGPFLGTGVEDWKRILDVNVWSVIHGCRLFAAQMVERGEGGHIVNVASAAAYSPSIAYPAYATTKAAVLMLTECLRAELQREGIGVTAVCPGFIDTDISRTTVHVGVDEQQAERLRANQIASYRRRGYPPEKVARRIVRAISANKAVTVVTPEAKTLRAIGRFAPAVGRRIARIDLNSIGRGRP